MDKGESPVPSWARFYFYGLHGVFDEIIFTSIFELLSSKDGNRRLLGYSTIFSFFIYGSCSFAVERLYEWLCRRRGVAIYWRVPFYLVVLYTWELFSGLLLRRLGACSWDYSHYAYNFMGLVTLEYVPCWLVLCVYQDVLSEFMLNLRIKCPPPVALTTKR